MTSAFKGIEPPLPPGPRSFPLPPSLPTAHSAQQPPRSWPRQAPLQVHNALPKGNPGDTLEPPLKKPKLEDSVAFQIDRATGKGTPKPTAFDHTASNERPFGTEQHEGKSRVHSRPLFPFRPGKHQSPGRAQQDHPLAIEPPARTDVVPVKAYVPEPPSCAPRYHEAGTYIWSFGRPGHANALKSGPADFFPWTGHHPEDVLNELTTRQGFYDKIQPSQSESSTARPSVWSSLKHKSGLQILSSLFVSALDQRQAHGTVTATSTFKPPPRVTLTDTKREAWLRDLANPLIPLRRLSRTIPHGIRGRVLLDHSLSKGIPISRAVWLAKCVGANEIRAFKRKGTGGVFTIGGEAKWIKDWTSNIEQFLESIIALCGSPEWKTRINYGLRLTSHLYSEHLLDRDHYLDWLLLSIESSDLDHLPIWLSVQQFHQQEILEHRRRGRRLASAILEHLCIANSSSVNREVYDPVLQHLIQLSRLIIVSAPACFLLPNSWNKYKDALRFCSISPDNDHLQNCYEHISTRNECLQNNAQRQNQNHGYSVRQRIITLLDTLSIKHDYGKVAATCLRNSKDHDLLVRTCVEWSCSTYRYGPFRTYAAARLLRIWNRRGVELQGPLLNFLALGGVREDLSREYFYRLIAGLVSSKHFSVGRYLQWLMARGTLQGRVNRHPGRSLDVGLLFQLPLHGLPAHILNLRQTLLSSIAEPSEAEESWLITCTKVQISERIPGFFSPTPQPFDVPKSAVDLISSNQTIKSDVARWIRQTVIKRLSHHEGVSDSKVVDQQTKMTRSGISTLMSLDEFLEIRRVLEDIGDFNILADVLHLISDQIQGLVLTAVTDTVNFYFDIFNVIGAADDIFRKLFGNVEIDQSQEVEKAFLESLIDLGCRLPKAGQEVQRLRKTLSAYAPKFPVAACSPISDTMVEAVQSTEPTFADEMDHVLASGTSMDKQTLTRVFATLIGQLEKSLVESNHFVVRFSQLLATLRGFGPKAFDVLLNEWLCAWLQRTPSRSPFMSLEPVICSKVVSLEVVLQAIVRTLDTQSNHEHKADMASSTLKWIVEARSGRMTTLDYRRYRVVNQLQSMLQTSPGTLMTILRKAVEARQVMEPTTCMRVQSEVESTAIIGLAQLILLRQAEASDDVDSSIDVSDANSSMQDGVSIMLSLRDSKTSTVVDFRQEVISILNDINDFNLVLFKLRLKAVLTSTMITPQDSTNTLSETLVELAISSRDGLENLWACLISELSATQASSIRYLAESQALAWAMNDSNLTGAGNSTPNPRLMAVVEASAFCVPVAETSRLVERIADNLSNILQANDNDTRLRIESDFLFERIDVLLYLLVIHQSTIQHPKYSQNILLQLLVALSLLLIDPLLTSHPTLLRRIFDILCLLTDSISDDTRLRCIHTLRDNHRVRDPRLRFVFGYPATSESEWLQLVTKSSSAADVRFGGVASTVSRPYPLRKWEMMQDATPVATENDTSLSLTLFGSRNSVL